MSARYPQNAAFALAALAASWVLALAPATSTAEDTSSAYRLVSGSATLQADNAYSPAFSANGRYVAFTGSLAGVQGVYRKDLQTGELTLVAGADGEDPALSAPDAGAPSISGDGQYVSFTTTKALDPAEDPGKGSGQAKVCSSVYVRNMDVPIGQPGAYILASALNGSSEGLTYTGSFASGESCPGGGSAAAARVAISESGQQVAFTIDGGSNLTGKCETSVTPVSCPTPPAQVAVRDLQTDTTTLVSQTLASLGSEPEPVPDGAALTDREDRFDVASNEAAAEIGDSTAAISAEGGTVAWMGIEIPAQAPATSTDAPESYPDQYDEPLWREVADGPNAPTRRVIGGDDPLCGCAGPLETQWKGTNNEPSVDSGPERGAYIAYHGLESGQELGALTPQLSANGQTVAILSTQPATGEIPVYTHQQPSIVSSNAYIVNMAEGLTRSQALTRLTAWASDEFDEEALAGAIKEIAISPNGTQVAFTTRRIIFPYSPPALVTPALSQEPVGAELYLADLPAGTLSMLSYGYEGSPANGNINDPTFGDNEELAFASGATNLIYGAYNAGGSDIFLTPILDATPESGHQSIGPLPASGVFTPEWVIGASIQRGPDGSVLVDVSVPGTGHLTASAEASVPITSTVSSAGHTKAKPTKHAKATRATKPSKKSGTPERVAERSVASADANPGAPGVVQLRLSAASRYRALVDSRDGLYGKLTITFTASGHSPLTRTLPVEFHYTPRPTKTKTAKKSGKKGSVQRSAKPGGKR